MGGQKLTAAGRFSCVSSETNLNACPWLSSDCGVLWGCPQRPHISLSRSASCWQQREAMG